MLSKFINTSFVTLLLHSLLQNRYIIFPREQYMPSYWSSSSTFLQTNDSRDVKLTLNYSVCCILQQKHIDLNWRANSPHCIMTAKIADRSIRHLSISIQKWLFFFYKMFKLTYIKVKNKWNTFLRRMCSH